MNKNSTSFVTIIMAAGKGRRMHSDLPKVLHLMAGKPLLHYVITLTQNLGSLRTILVIGHGREKVIAQTEQCGVEWAVQERQLGTGDAVKTCQSLLDDYTGDVLILSGDVPLLTQNSVSEAFQVHQSTYAAATVFTFCPDDPAGYGRVIRGADGEVLRIVEHKDASAVERDVGEVNGGMYLFKSKPLFEALSQISNKNQSAEYYLPDTLEIIRNWGQRISAYIVKDPIEMAGVNDTEQLGELEKYYLSHQAAK